MTWVVESDKQVVWVQSASATADWNISEDDQTGIQTDAATIQRAIDAAAAIASGGNNRAVVDLGGFSYLITEPIVFTAIHNGITLKNGSLIASSLFSNSASPIIYVNGGSGIVYSVKFKNLHIDAGRYAQGMLLDNTTYILVDECDIEHFSEYGIKAVTKGTELRIRSCTVNEHQWGETGYNVAASRTAKAYWIETADFTLIDSVGAYSGYCFYKSVSGGGQIIGSHFYSPSTDATEPYGVYCANPGQRSLVFVNTQLDNCIFGLENSFNVSLIGCSFFRSPNGNNTKAIEFITNATGETCKGFSAIGCKFQDINGAEVFTTDDSFITFSGTGTYATSLQLVWVNAITEDGVVPKWTFKANDAIDVSSTVMTLNKKLVMSPTGTAESLTVNGQVTFELTNNTTLTFKARGSDGTTRSGTVALS